MVLYFDMGTVISTPLFCFEKKKMQITANMWFWQLSAIYQSQGKQPLQVFGYVNEFVLSVICNDIKLC